jgi:thiol:disulfide interchange protein
MKLFTTLFLFFYGFIATAQDTSLVQFFIAKKKLGDTVVAVTITAKPKTGVKLFSIVPANKDIPVNSTVMADSNSRIKPLTELQETGKETVAKNAELQTNVKYYTDSVAWTQSFRATDSGRLAFWVDAFVDNGGSLESLPRQELKITLTPQKQITSTPTVAPAEKKGGLLSQTLVGLLLGFAAVFTPCVFPLLPMTASFFTKRTKSRSEGIRKAWLYAFFIIFIYTIPALLLAAFSGDGRLIYQISTSTIANLLFFAVFLVFAISFLGAFELTLPSSWSNAVDSKASGKGTLGIFFMALTMVIVSFSCTGPFVSGMLVATAQSGIGIAPIVGMLGFGIGFAVPFALMATFPGLLSSLPKSGGWLNSVKVVFGFIELALALKFFSNADQALHWGILNRDVFIASWIVLAVLLGAYLLGKLRFSHDSPMEHINLFRFFLALFSFIFALYLLPGMWGAPLESMSGILPNPSTQKFNLYESVEEIKARQGSGATATDNNKTITATKYTNLFKAPYGLPAFFDYEEGLAAAKKLNKPVMIDFTGHSCANCRKMEAGVWIDPEVQRTLQEDFVLIQLYVDDKTDLPDAEVYKDKSGQTISTLGNKNLDLEYNRFGDVSQPLYVFLDTNGELLYPKGVGYSDVGTVEKFQAHLNAMKAAFEKQK